MDAQKAVFEALESRTLLSGNVAAVVSSGVLTLTGDSQSNAITVTRSGNTVTITPDAATTVNKKARGAAVRVTGVTKAVRVNLGAGNDLVTIAGRNIGGTGTAFAVGGGGSDLTIDLGAGNDTLRLRGVQARHLSIVTGAGANSILVTGLNPDGAAGGPADVRTVLRGNLKVTGSGGDDSAVLQGLDVRGDVTLNMSTGGNTARLSPYHGSDADFDLDIGGNFAFDSSFALKANRVLFEDPYGAGSVEIGGSVQIGLGLMGDTLSAAAGANLSVGGTLFVNGCLGTDSISLANVDVGGVLILKAGDRYSLSNVSAPARWIDGRLTVSSAPSLSGLSGILSSFSGLSGVSSSFSSISSAFKSCPILSLFS